MGRSKKWDTHSKWLEREARRKEMGLLDKLLTKPVAKKVVKPDDTKQRAYHGQPPGESITWWTSDPWSEPEDKPWYGVDGREMERYMAADGKMYWRPKSPPEAVAPEPEPEPEKVVHKAGHFPIAWMIEAAKRASASDDVIQIESHETCVVVFGVAGETYAEYRIEWLAMEKAEVNPLVLAIENVERQIRVQLSLKAANG